MFINTQVQHVLLTSKYSTQIKGRGGKAKLIAQEDQKEVTCLQARSNKYV